MPQVLSEINYFNYKIWKNTAENPTACLGETKIQTTQEIMKETFMTARDMFEKGLLGKFLDQLLRNCPGQWHFEWYDLLEVRISALNPSNSVNLIVRSVFMSKFKSIIWFITHHLESRVLICI